MPATSGSFTADSQTSATLEGSMVELIVGGTIVATIQLQVGITGASGAALWVSVGQLTAAGRIAVEGPVGRPYRAAVTAWTSGPAYYSLVTATNDDLRV